MMPVAEACGVTIHCPKEGWFSFFNSPYPAHRLLTGIDIYPGLRFGEIAPSPVGGRLIAVREIRTPRGRFFEDVGYDIVVLMESVENPGKVVKLLHVEPTLRIGDTVEVGEELGRLIRSGYFHFWTDPHIHIEVREPSDPLRVRGGHRLRRLIKPRIRDPPEKLEGRITLIKPEYALLTLDGLDGGLTARVGDVPVLLDGGIPHYKWLGFHTDRLLMNGSVELCGQPIAVVEENYEGCALARCGGLRFEVKGRSVGLSLYLSMGLEASVKLVPPRPGALEVEEGEEVSIEIATGRG
jgi:hypothetical protein